MHSITTDYFEDTGNPFPYLRKISDAGFSYVHWCHEWSTNYLYTRDDIAEIKSNLRKYDLEILDIHASNGREISWDSDDNDNRAAAITLIKNRIKMAAEFDVQVIIMHISEVNDYLKKSLDELEKFAAVRGVKIAIENTKNFPDVDEILSLYDENFLGLCFDSGHANIEENAFTYFDKLKDRLISIHLHDNDGERDLHQIPFYGTTNWEEVTRIISESSYKKQISLEASIHNMKMSEDNFLKEAFSAAEKLSEMIF